MDTTAAISPSPTVRFSLNWNEFHWIVIHSLRMISVVMARRIFWRIVGRRGRSIGVPAPLLFHQRHLHRRPVRLLRPRRRLPLRPRHRRECPSISPVDPFSSLILLDTVSFLVVSRQHSNFFRGKTKLAPPFGNDFISVLFQNASNLKDASCKFNAFLLRLGLTRKVVSSDLKTC